MAGTRLVCTRTVRAYIKFLIPMYLLCITCIFLAYSVRAYEMFDIVIPLIIIIGNDLCSSSIFTVNNSGHTINHKYQSKIGPLSSYQLCCLCLTGVPWGVPDDRHQVEYNYGYGLRSLLTCLDRYGHTYIQ